jgi:Trypsin
MHERRPPLGAMLLGLTGLLAGWSMAALAGTGTDRVPSRGDAPPRDVPMVVAPPGGSGPQHAPPSPPATQPRPKAEAPRRAARATAPSPRTPTTTAAPGLQAEPADGVAAPPTAPTAPAAPAGQGARPSPPTTALPVQPAPPTAVPPVTVPPPPPGGAPKPPPAGPRCDVPRNQPPWAEQAELLDVVEATQRVLDENGSAGFAGFVVTPEKCRLDLYWVSEPPNEVSEVVRRDGRVVVHNDADYDHTELAQAAEALSPGSPLGPSAGVEITSVAVTPEGSGLRVGVEPRRRVDVRATAARLSAAAGVPVNVVIEGRSRPFGRIDDEAPWSAGGQAMIRVSDGGSERWAACSLGYGLRDPRTMREYTITAAHCFDEAVDATAWNGSRRATIGDWGAMSLALDVAYVATDESAGRPGTSAHVWSGAADAADEGVRTVTDTAPTVKGMWVCSSGAATGENCGIKVTDVDVMQRAPLPRSGAAYTVRHTARGYRAGGGVASGSGDSGGPVFAPDRPGRSDAHAVGVIHGGVDGASVSCGAPNPTECSESVIFVPVAEVQRWIGGELRVADGWRSSSPSSGPDR